MYFKNSFFLDVMDIDKEILKHADWKARFSNAIFKRQPLEPSFMKSISKVEGCELGKWLQGEGKALFEGAPSYEACLKLHAEFHREAEKVANIINAKHYANAYKMIDRGSVFSFIAKEISCQAKRLKNECGL